MTPPVALTIAGSDSGAGAGLQADLKAFAALGVFGTCAVTAITAQSTAEVRCVEPVRTELVEAQIRTVLDDLPVRAVKTGMLATAWTVERVAALAAEGLLPNLVVDPVLVSSTGTRLTADVAVRAYVDALLPHAAVITPNLHEAGVLLGTTITTRAAQHDAARELSGRTGAVVVVKGGHAVADERGDAVDVVAGPGIDAALSAPRVDTANNHGSGCTFAAATAAGLAQGLEPLDALRRAKQYVHRAIEGAARWDLGRGHGPLDHFHWEAT